MIYCHHIVILLVATSSFVDVNKAEKAVSRNGKVFSLFSIVTFPNAGCASQSSIGNTKARNGTCFTSTECTEKGGTVSGNCAAGFGVCCLFITSAAGGSVDQNCSYIQNPNFPNAYASAAAISYTINKCSSDVCTLRLDFETFTTAGPTTTSDVNAAVDTLQITTTPNQGTISALAGENSGYHAYVEVGPDTGATATLAFTFGTSTLARTWDIKVTQLACSSTSRPASGCLQYFTQSSGRIESYNFPGDAATPSIQQHLHSQNQNICIRSNGFRCIRYTACSETNSFTVSGPAITNVGTLCSLDFVEITGAFGCGSMDNFTPHLADRICGEVFGTVVQVSAAPMAVCDCTAPFNVNFVTNSHVVDAGIATVPNRGFCLEYEQFN